MRGGKWEGGNEKIMVSIISFGFCIKVTQKPLDTEDVCRIKYLVGKTGGFSKSFSGAMTACLPDE
jgi:hypothetical protein